MVLDKIENYKLYENINDRITKAFEYLNKTDLVQLESGKYEIDGENIFALVQEYNTKSMEEGRPESHFKYIDIQYIISGIECIGVNTLTNQIPTEIYRDKDVAFYACESTLLRLNQGMFAIFFPDDLHMPGIKFTQISKVKKVVIKVKI